MEYKSGTVDLANYLWLSAELWILEESPLLDFFFNYCNFYLS